MPELVRGKQAETVFRPRCLLGTIGSLTLR